MDFDQAMAWFNGILSGDDWTTRDCVEVIDDDGLRSVRLTVWGSRWTLEIEVEESGILGGVIVSARVRDPADGHQLPPVAGLSKVLVP